MIKTPFTLLTCLLVVILHACIESTSTDQSYPVTKIAFGSCGSEQHPLPIFHNIVQHQPDLFVFLGDNIYGDTKDMEVLRKKYQQLGNKESFKELKAHVPIIATWDDHDFGWNDAGKEYPFKEESKELFLDFFEEPENSPRRKHPGIYTSYRYEYGDNTLQIILLDGRTFRDTLKPYSGEFDKDKRYDFYQKDYAPHSDPSLTLLGEAQWSWLKEELQKPADIRLIGSGTQFGVEWNGYEAWANFPHEQQRMLNLIKSTKANGVLFITGDVHYSEISKLETDFYPLYDFTSSGLSSTWKFATPNANRIEGPVMDNHFGLITIEWKEDPQLRMETWDIHDNQRIEYTVNLSDLQLGK